MDSVARIDEKKPHVILIPFPDQSHIKAMLKLAELLHHKGLQITFVNTDFINDRLLQSMGPHSLDGSPGFRFQTIPDDVPRTSESSSDTIRDLLMHSLETTFLPRFVNLVNKLPNPPACIISDGFLSVFTIDAAQVLGIPIMLCWTLAACGFMGFYQIQSLIEKGFVPIKDESCLTNGYLDTIVDWVPGMEGIRLKDFPMDWTLDVNNKFLMFTKEAPQRSDRVPYHIFHTFDELETSLIKVLSSMYAHVYTIGPLQLLLDQIPINGELIYADVYIPKKSYANQLWRPFAKLLAILLLPHVPHMTPEYDWLPFTSFNIFLDFLQFILILVCISS